MNTQAKTSERTTYRVRPSSVVALRESRVTGHFEVRPWRNDRGALVPPSTPWASQAESHIVRRVESLVGDEEAVLVDPADSPFHVIRFGRSCFGAAREVVSVEGDPIRLLRELIGS